MHFFSTPLLNYPKSECLAMSLGRASRNRRDQGGVASPESFLGCYLIKSYENPAAQITFAGGYRSSITGLWP